MVIAINNIKAERFYERDLVIQQLMLCYRGGSSIKSHRTQKLDAEDVRELLSYEPLGGLGACSPRKF